MQRKTDGAQRKTRIGRAAAGLRERIPGFCSVIEKQCTRIHSKWPWTHAHHFAITCRMIKNHWQNLDQYRLRVKCFFRRANQERKWEAGIKNKSLFVAGFRCG